MRVLAYGLAIVESSPVEGLLALENVVWPEVERGLSGDAGRTALTLPSVIYPIGKGAVALGQPRRGRSTDRGCSRHDSGVEPDEGAESERAVGRADEAEIRREEEQTDGGAVAESRPAELPGEPSEAKGCRGGARAEAGRRGRARDAWSVLSTSTCGE